MKLITILLVLLFLPAVFAYDVELVSQTPSATWQTVQFNNNGNGYPFGSMEFLPGPNGGKFIVSGDCCSGSQGCSAHEAKGMYIFNGDGTYAGLRDVCIDGSKYRMGCNELGGCDHGVKIQRVSDTQFLTDNGITRNDARPSILYEATSTGATLVAKSHYDQWTHSGPANAFTPYTFTNGEVSTFRNIAYANGVEIGVETTSPAGSSETVNWRGTKKLSVRSIPSMQEIASFTQTPPGSTEIYTPIIGIGNYFLARKNADTVVGATYVYKMPTAAQLQQGQRPELVQTLAYPNLLDFRMDPTNTNRIQLMWQDGGGTDTTFHLDLYATGANGLDKISTQAIPLSESTGMWAAIIGMGQHARYAFYKDYFITIGCQATNSISACTLIVKKNGQALSVQPFPADYDPTPFIQSLAVSDTGRILVATKSWPFNDNGRIYAFQIKEENTQPPVTPPATTSSALSVVAGGPGRYVYKTGYYLNAQGTAWVPFAFGTPPVSGTNWINGTATTTLTTMPPSGYVLTFSCKKYPGRDGFICGPRTTTQPASERYWTIEFYNLTTTGTTPSCTSNGGFCTSSAPTYSHTISGTCSSGACYACNSGYNYQGGACVSSSGGTTCMDNGGFCATSAPANSQSSTGTCSSGTCYRCASGYNYQSGSCVAGGTTLPPCLDQPRTLCNTAAVPGATQLTGYQCAQFEPSQSNRCYQCPAGQNPDPIMGTCVSGTVTSFCENNPGMKCIATPNSTTMDTNSKFCDFSGLDGATYYFTKSCAQCKAGYSWSGGTRYLETCTGGSGTGGAADTSASACTAATDVTPRDVAHYGTGGGGDQGIAYLSPWKGDSTGTQACCGNQAGEYLVQRVVSGASDTSVRACCNAESDCLTPTGQCITHLNLMPSSTTEYCYYNGIHVCSSSTICLARTHTESPYECYRTTSGSYQWLLKTNAPAEVCTDSIDNDCDGQTDCADSSCSSNAACAASQNVRIKDIAADSDYVHTHYINAYLCREVNIPLAGQMTWSMRGTKTRESTITIPASPQLPLCSEPNSLPFGATSNGLFDTVPTSGASVSITFTFSNMEQQYNHVTTDDTLTKTIIIP